MTVTTDDETKKALSAFGFKWHPKLGYYSKPFTFVSLVILPVEAITPIIKGKRRIHLGGTVIAQLRDSGGHPILNMSFVTIRTLIESLKNGELFWADQKPK